MAWKSNACLLVLIVVISIATQFIVHIEHIEHIPNHGQLKAELQKIFKEEHAKIEMTLQKHKCEMDKILWTHRCAIKSITLEDYAEFNEIQKKYYTDECEKLGLTPVRV